jgi:hypothetical protein
MLLDWLITGQVLPTNPAAASGRVRTEARRENRQDAGARETQARKLLKSIPDTTLRDLRDRASVATLNYTFAPINAALKIKVEDLRPRAPDGQSSCTTKAVSSTACRAITRSPRHCSPILTQPGSSSTARAFALALVPSLFVLDFV